MGGAPPAPPPAVYGRSNTSLGRGGGIHEAGEAEQPEDKEWQRGSKGEMDRGGSGGSTQRRGARGGERKRGHSGTGAVEDSGVWRRLVGVVEGGWGLLGGPLVEGKRGAQRALRGVPAAKYMFKNCRILVCSFVQKYSRSMRFNTRQTPGSKLVLWCCSGAGKVGGGAGRVTSRPRFGLGCADRHKANTEPDLWCDVCTCTVGVMHSTHDVSETYSQPTESRIYRQLRMGLQD